MLYISATYAVARCSSVCPSVTFVYSVETNKHIFEMFSPSGSRARLVFQFFSYFSFVFTKQQQQQVKAKTKQTQMALFRPNSPNGGVECGWDRQQSRLSTNIWLSDRWLLECDQQSTVDRTAVKVDVRLPHRSPRISESCLSQPAWTTTPKTREHNVIVCSGKTEAEVTNNRRLRSTYCTIETITDGHEASRGLSARA